ncbi:inactive phospholipase D5 isoform X1 [Perca flavescens]|uniref:inactive phospholipase D5 isoform X1 n=1 Tax=Perca flavescens TaxID=8167 RepID=UPI00106DE7A2|nr:inactive phospholipase D5-like isoform X1 [Perca flavescens]XP_028459333.1 inactive phospholipase D5-like isoform X1 [Perca flavescens]XP_028459334.1 inactive phospholipase D5-like isoform X1 [Perca flavescens]
MELRGTRGTMGLDSRGQGLGFGMPAIGIPASSILTAVQHQDYSAGVWLRRKDKLEHSQQKCIMIFALVCCFAVLMALIFSAVDFWGEDEDGITEDNCSRNCRVVLVENIPEDISFLDNGTSHLPLSVGLYNLLDRAIRVVEIVSPLWLLNSSDYESSFQPAARQGRALLTRLQGLKAKGIQLKISSGMIDSTELGMLAKHNAEVHYVNMTALTKGQLHSSFWVVDRKHFYIGSASMDWRSLATRKELGVLVYNCSCLALDLHKVFSLYWGLQYRDFIPSFWSKRLFALFNRDTPLELTLNSTKAQAYVSSSPDVFIPKDRSSDLEAISRVIQEARHFIYISIIDYLPLLSRNAHRYWSRIDGLIREALILRKVRVRLLISCWEKTHPLTFNFIWSLRSLCMGQANCSMEAKIFNGRVQRDGSLQGINHNRFMVTDRSIYLGNLDWVGNEFSYNAGAGLVISQPEGIEERNSTVVEQLRAAFERDWFSRYTRSLQSNKIPVCNKPQIKRLMPVRTSHLDNGQVLIRTGQHDNGPAPIRHNHKDDGQTAVKTKHNDDRLSKVSRQEKANGLVPIIDSYQERGRVEMSHLDDRQVQIKGDYHDNPKEPPSQSAESSGSREIFNRSL